MDQNYLEEVFTRLHRWSKSRDYAGYDPFDGLNSWLFAATFLRRSRSARLFWTQLLKRSPVNLRPLLGVTASKNAKGIALFALAALAQHRYKRTTETEHQSRALLEQLLQMQLKGWTGAAWGYNFDWQSRVLFAPRETPTIVPTAFASKALLEGYEIFGDATYLRPVRSACDFILRDLPRSVETENEICFSYSPLSTTRIYNASLLAAEILFRVSFITGEEYLRAPASRATRYVLQQQRADGSWTYGADENQAWRDSFHTAFILNSLGRIARTESGTGLAELKTALRRGFAYWHSTFFLAEGWPKYYDDALYPADTHSAAAAIVTLCDLRIHFPEHLSLAPRIAEWAIAHLWDQRGFFYYQRRRFFTVRTPFMRWSQAWMLYAMGRLLEELNRSPAEIQSTYSLSEGKECL